MKKNVIYAIAIITGMTMAFFPIGGESPEPNIFDLLHIERNPGTEIVKKQLETEMTINETEFISASSSEQAAKTEPVNIEETEADTAAGHDILSVDGNMDTETEIEKNDLVNESNDAKVIDQPGDHATTTTANVSGTHDNTAGTAPVLPERKSIPGQAENTSCASQTVLDQIRSQVYQYIHSSAAGMSESQDLKNAAIAKLNGTGSNALDVLISYGGEGWSSADWQELSAYDYCLDTSAIAITDVTNTICSYLGKSFANYSNVGVGVAVTPDDGCYKVTVEVILTD